MLYSAFVSYNHRDRNWAGWLHRSLERYRVPKHLWGRTASFGAIGPRLPRVFRDREELASSADLASSVKTALAQAATLLVICSPNSARSRWVDQEVRTFIAAGKRDRILCIIVDGEPNATDPDRECFPMALRESGGPEPLAADARVGGDGRKLALLKLLAGVLGVPFDELRQRDAQRRQRRLALLAVGSFAGFLLTGGLAVVALVSRAEAVEQRDIARQRSITAERTLNFVKNMFRVSDPSEARGETITARDVVDRGARLLDSGLQNEPTARVELGITLAEVYGALGLLQRSNDLLARTRRIPQGDELTSARLSAALGESQYRLGNYAAALAAFAQAQSISQRLNAPELLSRVLAGVGQSQSALGNEVAADRALSRALKIDRARGRSASADVARDLEALGLNKFFGGEFDKAEPLIRQALQLRLAIEGPASPSVADNRNTLANIAHGRGQLGEAEALYRTNLASDKLVLGADHPDFAITLNNLARVLLEQRRFAEAAELLEQAITISLKQRAASHGDMTFLFSNLALAYRHSGKITEARRRFAAAVATARSNHHRFLGPVLTDMAELECATGQWEVGLAHLTEAKSLVAADFPEDPWRAAWTENVRGGCLLAHGDAAGARIIERSSPLILARWPRQTLFGFEAARRERLARNHSHPMG